MIPPLPARFDESQYDFTLTLLAPLLMIAFGFFFVLRGWLLIRRSNKRRKFERENWSPMLRSKR